jgi:hypothetical protein
MASLLYDKATTKSMRESDSWKTFVDQELEAVSNILTPLGFILEENQPHTKGEGFLTTKDKLVFVGKRQSDDKKVIIKASKHTNGKNEIIKEKNVRDTLKKILFAADTILFPEEIEFIDNGDYLFHITEFIDQDSIFIVRDTEEQFFLALRALEAQEAFHATTFEHIRSLSDVFQVFHARDYFEMFSVFRKTISMNVGNSALDKSLEKAENLMRTHKKLIDSFCNYLSHTDFAPSNFRMNNREIYFIDLSSIGFGNKYEGWARFLNYALVHSPELEQLLSDYVRKNRGEQEYLDLRLMRIYKVGFLLNYYAGALKKTSGNLQELTRRRISFWELVLENLLLDKQTDSKKIADYKNTRNSLRSSDELERQKQFNILS